MDSELIWLMPGSYSIPARLSGRIIRLATKASASVTESFVISLEDSASPSQYIDDSSSETAVCGVERFENVPGWDPALVYSRQIPGTDRDGFDIQTFFSGNTAAKRTSPILINLLHYEPIPAPMFWDLVSVLRGSASKGGVRALRRRLSSLPETEIAAFALTLWGFVASLPDATGIGSVDLADSMSLPDSSLYWRMAAVACGREFYEAALSQNELQLSDLEWSDGENLVDLCESAYSDRADRQVLFTLGSGSETVDVDVESLFLPEGFAGPYPLIESLVGQGTIDLRPGPRTGPEMWARGLNPSIVGSRFIVARSDTYVECVALQRIDMHNEDVDRHLDEAAQSLAKSIGGVLVSSVEGEETSTPTVYDDFELITIKRRWKGSLGEYLQAYGLRDLSNPK